MEKLIGSFSPSRKLPDGLGLQGEQLDLAKAHINIAKSVTKHFDALRGRGYNDPQIIERMSKTLGMLSDVIRAFVKVHKFYSAPTDSRHTEFKYFFLCAVGMHKLSAFVPILKAYYENKDGLFARSIVITEKSIELRVHVAPNCYRWVHLANLSVDQIKSFAKSVASGAPAGENQFNMVPVSATATIETQKQQAPSKPLDENSNQCTANNQSPFDPNERSVLNGIGMDPMGMGYNEDDPMGMNEDPWPMNSL